MNLFHPSTETLVAGLRTSRPQSLLISGQAGVGLIDVAHVIAAGNEASVVFPDESKASRPITTEAIRELYSATRSKSQAAQFVIIHEAEAMAHSAQAAFLKLLEEPGTSIYFILTSTRPDDLLPTILSRVQHHTINPITRDQSEELLTELGIRDDTKRRQMLYIAEGLPEELARLATDSDYFEAAAQRMKDARELLQAPLYEKLIVVNSYRENRAHAIRLVQAAINMTRRSLSERPQASLVNQLEKLLAASERLESNGNVRLCLTQLVL